MSFAKLAFTPLVKKLQELYGSRMQYAPMEKLGDSRQVNSGRISDRKNEARHFAHLGLKADGAVTCRSRRDFWRTPVGKGER